MKRIKGLIFVSIFTCSLIIPTSAFAATNTTQSYSNTGVLQLISTFLSSFNTKTTVANIQTTTNKNGTYSNSGNDDWYSCFWNWLCGGDKGNGGDDDQCKNTQGSWGNDDGCVDSAEIWKRWYCN